MNHATMKSGIGLPLKTTAALVLAALAACVALVSATSALAQNIPANDLADRAIHRRAVEAVIWGMPAVNYDLMLQQMLTKTKGKVNAILYWSRPLDWKNQTLTPNPDSIYLMAFYNTKDVGPVVIEVPPADNTGSLAGNIVDVWQMPLEDAGPQGADKGRGGKYVILPPGYKGRPPSGYIPLQSDTYGGYALLRSNLASHSDMDVAKSVAYGRRVKVYPLSQASRPPPAVFTDAMDVLFDSTIRYDHTFFENLDRIVQNEPWLQRDRAMIDQLKTIGIEKGKPFNPDAKTQQIFNAAALEAKAYLARRYDAGFPQFNPGIYWTLPTAPELVDAAQSGFADPNAYPVDARGTAYTYAFVGIKRLGTAQFYLIAIKDKNGQAFDGGTTYRLTVPPNAPVKQYWSATAYDRETHALIRNMPRASRSSQVSDLHKNTDGSVDIYFGPQALHGKETNWVPTDPSRQFEVMFRLYGPEKPFFDRNWVLPDIEPIATVGRGG
jgi:hypothetical protein